MQLCYEKNMQKKKKIENSWVFFFFFFFFLTPGQTETNYFFPWPKKKFILEENFVCKEKSGNVTKVKLVTKMKKHIIRFILELWQQHQIVEISHKIQTSFLHWLQRK